MTAKIIKIAIPPIISLLAVAGLFKFGRILYFNLFTTNPYTESPLPLDFIFYILLLMPVVLLAIAFQAIAIIPLWIKYKNKHHTFGLRFWQLILLFSLLGGIIYGFLFRSAKLGLPDFIEVSLTGTILFIIYWTLNLSILFLLDKTKYGA